jgi:hypothetical protein
MYSRDTTINNFYELLIASDTIDELSKKHNLYIKHHNFLPIAIINYGRIDKIKKNKDIDACRGLIIDTHTKKIISRGFDRFIPKYQDPHNIINVTRATIKEDGSLIFMFKYEDNWYLSTMHDFADNILPAHNSTTTYSELFLQIINQPLNVFAESILSQFTEEKEQIITLCFEMCSLHNRVIRTYTTPQLFLISAFGGTNGSTEFTIDSKISLPPNVSHITELDYLKKTTFTFEELQQKVIDLTLEDFTFEGFVIQTDSGERIKVKNPLYLIQHKLKYRGWSTCTPELIIPLILNNSIEKVIHNVKLCVDNDWLFCEEVDKRIKKYTEILDRDFSALQLILDNGLKQITKIEYITYIKSVARSYFDLYKSLIMAIYNTKIFTKDVYNKFVLRNISRLYSNKDYFIETHPRQYCKFNYEEAETKLMMRLLEDSKISSTDSKISSIDSGMSSDPMKCYCGEKMIISRLKRDLTRYKFCHCGETYGYTIYKSGTYLAVCSNTRCLCTHEVNQITKMPLGFPANIYCKSLRLIIHSMMSDSKLSKEESYDKISLITGKSKEDAHMAKFGIQDCMMILSNFDK